MLLDKLNIRNIITINDNDTGISYVGGWAVSSNRGAGDYQNDVHYVGTNNSYFEYTFTGNGIEVIIPKSSSQGNVDIYIDDVLQSTVNTQVIQKNFWL